jgi:uncharacterized repeat protein (TIGR03803 family)
VRSYDYLRSGSARSFMWARALTVCCLSLLVGQHAPAQTEAILYSFGSYYGDATTPYAPLAPVFSSAGEFTGTTTAGGEFGGGTVFEIDSSRDEWLPFAFGGDPQTGYAPHAGVIFSNLENIYGTTYEGGSSYGTVFEISSADYTEQVLHDFNCGPVDGCYPIAGLVMDAKGNLYGTTLLGGTASCDCGTVFSLTGPGKETEAILHSFSGPPDGSEPWAALVIQNDALYGTTYSGGTGTLCTSGCGTVFRINSSGEETVVYNFSGGSDGSGPKGALISDLDGNLYGTTTAGGAYGHGTVFKLAPTGKESLLYSFTGEADGAGPVGPLLIDKHGNLYGVAAGGGNSSCQCGTVFELQANGTERTLHTFGSGTDGQFPNGGLSVDEDKNLYGTTSAGGGFGYGIVFKIAP